MLDVMYALTGGGDAHGVVDLGASAVGQQPPSWILKPVREADPEVARGYIATYNANKSTLDARVTELQQSMSTLQSDWTGEAADKALAYLEKVAVEVDGLAGLNGAIPPILEAAINVMKATQRQEDDAVRVFAIAVITASVAAIAAIAIATASIFGAPSIPGIVGAFVGFLITIIASLIGYLIALKIVHERQIHDLTEQLDKLKNLTPGDPLEPVSSVTTPDLEPVTIKVTIAEPPAVPAF